MSNSDLSHNPKEQLQIIYSLIGKFGYEHNQRLNDCACVAELLGNDSIDSLYRCLTALHDGKARLYPDSSPLSFGFKMAGMYGGFIFFHSCKDWSLHT